MTTFIIGLVILIGGAALYGRFCEKVFGPDDRKTPIQKRTAWTLFPCAAGKTASLTC